MRFEGAGEAEQAVTQRVAQDYADARVTRNYGRIWSLLHPDAVFFMPACRSSAYFKGHCRGRDLICAMIRRNDTLLQFFDERVVSMLVDHNRAAVEWSAMLRNRGTGHALAVSGCAVVTVSCGLITSYTHYIDTAAIEELVRKSLLNDL